MTSEIAKLLIEVKVTRSRCLKAKKLDGPKYDAMTDAVLNLYNYLDRVNIATLESIAPKADKAKPALHHGKT